MSLPARARALGRARSGPRRHRPRPRVRCARLHVHLRRHEPKRQPSLVCDGALWFTRESPYLLHPPPGFRSTSALSVLRREFRCDLAAADSRWIWHAAPGWSVSGVASSPSPTWSDTNEGRVPIRWIGRAARLRRMEVGRCTSNLHIQRVLRTPDDNEIPAQDTRGLSQPWRPNAASTPAAPIYRLPNVRPIHSLRLGERNSRSTREAK